MKPVITKEMIGEAIRQWAKKQNICETCGRSWQDNHEFKVLCKENNCGKYRLPQELICVPGLPEHCHNSADECVPLHEEHCEECHQDCRCLEWEG